MLLKVPTKIFNESPNLHIYHPQKVTPMTETIIWKEFIPESTWESVRNITVCSYISKKNVMGTFG